MKKVIVILSAMILFSGCAATQVALSKKDLKVENRMSATIFLDVDNMAEKSIYLDIRNTSAKDIDITPFVLSNLEGKGYKITKDAKSAFYLMQANILFVGQADQTALEQSVTAGFGGALAGAAVGAAASGASNSSILTGAAVGGLIGGAAEMLSGSFVKDVTYSIITDIQISEKTKEKVEQDSQAELETGAESSTTQTSETTVNRKKYQSRLATTANQVNLTFEEAQPMIEEGLIRAISGLF
ncbi:complement resistance protein TraT [Desulforegula conservatrix]|uniref:complement resistance protein TraT n=1 Tax=Desulforegula conservatrix TaxID=153026 RepID=UPI0003F540A8|nr:complement resistance protein TraT [Desulforegula conservatrix]